ncbi:MAG: hypothetical protein AB7S41_07945 [Parvibaculaceae bacterium]
MRRAAILLALGLIAATDVSANDSQRLNSEPPRKYSDSEGGFWSSFAPPPSGPAVQPAAAKVPPKSNLAAEAESPTVRSNVAQPDAVRSNVGQPVALQPEASRQRVQETPRKRVQEAPRKRKATRSQKKKTAKAPPRKERENPETAAEEKIETASTEKPTGAKKFFSGSEARWWEETGNPAVFVFSGCVADYAAASVRTHVDLPHAEYLTRAMTGPCKGEFDTMAGLILKRHGEEGFATVSKELIDTTFIPAVRDAVAKATAGLQVEEKNRATLGAELQVAKSAMFACFVRETDRLAATSPDVPQAVAETVIATCQPEATHFFAKLDELYPDVSADDRQTQESALTQSYLPAILSRVASVRAGAARVSAQ